MRVSRLLLLGLLLRGPLHGYQVRHVLETWSAERWANLAYGSIYFGLRKLAEEGLLQVAGTEPGQRGPARTVFALTEHGRQEFDRLLREAWWQPHAPVDPFQVALTFMDQLPRPELLSALRRRAHLLRSEHEGLGYAAEVKLAHPDTPRHVAENLRLLQVQNEATLLWTEELIGKVERGELP